MSSVGEYLAVNKDLLLPGVGVGETIVLKVIVLGITETHINFSHMGEVFSIHRDDVIDICDVTTQLSNPYGHGKPAAITVRTNTHVSISADYEVADLVSELPFALVTSKMKPEPVFPSEKELQWKASVGYKYTPTLALLSFIGIDTSHETISYAGNPPVPNDEITDQGC